MPLVPLSLLKSTLNIPSTDISRDDELEFALEAASTAVEDYADRSFDLQTSTTPTEREYEYDGSGWLEIDDCTSVAEVRFDDRVLNADDWHAHPLRKPTFYYIVLHDNYYGQSSPEMGFKWNADRLPFHPVTLPMVTVTAAWGWPVVPHPVQQATLWTAIALTENPRPYISESIEGYTRAIGEAPTFFLPARAEAALAPYVRIKV